ncbi:AraC family transcriptional regulator [Actinoplanes sp. TBRC 11911]|uniref:AraC family transcriptional regulator n=1 Tax=Actinoplanes sp. TBRC 11911 TaxID=2729386 RepID=UPI00145E048B|nr:AraC family transcriptional regulator [Actinoplanes sp. TBRC 11911]NMO55227.1 AraC family transcriptional regulator [Actinoplanes sp. TBRC 11911]
MGADQFAAQPGQRGRLTSRDNAADVCHGVFFPHTVEQLDPGRGFDLDYRLTQVGPLTLAEITHHTDVRLDFAELRTGYYVNVPLSGAVRSRHRGIDVTATTETASVSGPVGETVVTRWVAGTRNLALRIDGGVVDRTLAEALRGGGAGFDPSFDLRTGPGRSWLGMLRVLRDQLDDPDSVLHRPMTAMPFVESLVTGFCTVSNPAFRQALDRAAEPIPPAAVRTAVDIMHARPQLPLTTAELARRCNVSVRTLQEGFQRHLGVAPMAYLRSVRLERAHADLRAADPGQDTVSAIAYRWGFGNLTRFAHQHRMTYGQSPKETLRVRAGRH